jgi:hypothetical protein
MDFVVEVGFDYVELVAGVLRSVDLDTLSYRVRVCRLDEEFHLVNGLGEGLIDLTANQG